MQAPRFSRNADGSAAMARVVIAAAILAALPGALINDRATGQTVGLQLERLPTEDGPTEDDRPERRGDSLRTAAATIPPSADGPSFVDDYLQGSAPLEPGTLDFQHGLTEAPQDDLQLEHAPQSPTGRPLPKGAKPGMLQRTTLRGTWLAGGDGDQFGMTDLTAQAMLAVPLYIRGAPLLLTPNYTVHYLDGPDNLDVPAQLYDAGVEFRWMNQLTDRWGVDIAVAPSVFSDFENTSSDALRVTGRAIGAWQWTPTTQVVVGAVYLGREDFVALPAFGLICKPDEDTVVELIMPRPRYSKRLSVQGDLEHWWYLAGEFGGNTWAIERSDGVNDNLTYSDLRLVVGLERKLPGGLAGRIEAGYVFAREIEFESGLPGLDPEDTAMLRGEVSF